MPMAKPRNSLVRIAVRLGYALEAAPVALALGLFKLLPVDAASALGGRIARFVGPLLPVARVARRNLERCFPEMDAAQRRRVLRDMWDNLGRVLAEYPHLGDFTSYAPNAHVEVIGVENVDLLRDDGKPGLFFSGHLGNWELNSHSVFMRGIPIVLFYRAPNNPFVDAMLTRARGHVATRSIPKGPRGARDGISVLARGGHIGMLVDQKMNDGIAVPFFGRPAMTAPALAQLALRFDCPVVPARIERLRGTRFRLTFYPPLEIPRTGDRSTDVRAIMTEVNRILEGWVRETPSQWLWPHRRWPD